MQYDIEKSNVVSTLLQNISQQKGYVNNVNANKTNGKPQVKFKLNTYI